MGGLWEFPGGKVEDGEAPVAALKRELEEELAITVGVGSPLTFAVHEEPGMRLLLLFFNAVLNGQIPKALEGQEIVWVAPEDLRSYPTPPADAVLIELANRVRLTVGDRGEACRYGGEELLVMFPDTTLEYAEKVGREVVSSVAQLRIPVGGKKKKKTNLRITVSGGLAAGRSGKDDVMAVLESADRALYRAKRLGRNRLTVVRKRTTQ